VYFGSQDTFYSNTEIAQQKPFELPLAMLLKEPFLSRYKKVIAL